MNEENLFANNVKYFLRTHPLHRMLPFLAYEEATEEGELPFFILEDGYLGLLFPYRGRFQEEEAIGGVHQRTVLNLPHCRFDLSSMTPPRSKKERYGIPSRLMGSFNRTLRPHSREELAALDEELTDLRSSFFPLFRENPRFPLSALFDFFSALGCAVTPYDGRHFVRDYICLEVGLEEEPVEPLFLLNKKPIYVYTAKSDRSKIFHNLRFVEKIPYFGAIPFLANSTRVYKKDTHSELGSLIFFEKPDEKALELLRQEGVFTQKESWRALIVFLNSLPLSMVRSFFWKSQAVMERVH